MSGTANNKILDTIHALQHAPSLLKVTEVFRRAVEPYGVNAFLCSSPPRPDEGPLDPLLLDGWPRAWRNRYVARNYWVRDTTVRAMFATYQPFTWDEAVEMIRPEKKDLVIFDEARAWGMWRGLVVPIFGAGGQVSVVTLAGKDLRLDAEARPELHLLAMYGYARAKQLRKTSEKPVELTDRQVEVLQWVALGKSDWDISQLLHISENTVHKHVEEAKRRLGVSTRMQAVVAAFRQGTIRL